MTVRLVVGPSERWPDVDVARDTGQKRLLDDEVIEVDEETAQRWERGIAAYDALVAEIWAAVDAEHDQDGSA